MVVCSWGLESETKKFAQQNKAKMPILADPGSKMAKAYRVTAPPAWLLIGADGKFIGKFASLDGAAAKKIEAALPKHKKR